MNEEKNRKRLSAGCILLVGACCCYGEDILQTVPVRPSAKKASTRDSRGVVEIGSTVSRLQELEKKAGERDLYLARTRELQKKLDLLTGRNDHVMMQGCGGGNSPVFGQLSKLKEKATFAEQMSRLVEKLRRENERLIKKCDDLGKELIALSEKSVASSQRVVDFEKKNEKLEEKNLGLQETIGRLLLGEFEYYEVKTGETLHSVAANPLVYGDSSRAGWLRQANEGRVRDLNRLRDGDMLVVPRFPRTGAYEF